MTWGVRPPRWPFAVDWSAPLARSLAYAVFPWNFGERAPIFTRTGMGFVTESAASASLDIVPVSESVGLRRMQGTSNDAWTTPYTPAFSSFSVAWHGSFYWATLSASDFCVGQYNLGGGTYNWGLYLAYSTRYRAFYNRSGSGITGGPAINSGQRLRTVARHKAGQQNLYGEGALLASGTDGSNPASSEPLRMSGPWTFSQPNRPGTVLEACLIFDEFLSDDEVQLATWEPYSVVEEYGRRTFVIPTAAGGGFQAAWARGSNTVIQAVA